MTAMKFLVEYTIFDEVVSKSEIGELRKAFAQQLERIQQSKKVLDSGLFVGTRGGYFVIKAESGAEIHRLLSPTIVDNCKVRIQLVMSILDFRQLIRSKSRAG